MNEKSIYAVYGCATKKFQKRLTWNPSSVSELLSLILMPPTPPWAQVL